MKCRNHPDITATATARMPASTPPYTRRVPLCSKCALALAHLGDYHLEDLEDGEAVLQRMIECGDARMNDDGTSFTLTEKGVEHARKVLALLNVDPDDNAAVQRVVQRLAAPRN